jgi:SAM-dependent methyltransferase
MQHEGDVVRARERFFRERPRNLEFLLRKRYGWMNDYIADGARVVEFGAGAGFSREFIHATDFILTDFATHPWIDVLADAMDPPFPDDSMDVVICSSMLHHLASPIRFLKCIRGILKPGGYILIQDVRASLLMRALLRLMRHEGWSYDVDVFDENAIANDPRDIWSGNNSIADLLFADAEAFEAAVPGLQMLKWEFNECLIFPLSGGVIATKSTIDLPEWALGAIDSLDKLLIKMLPSVFALCCSVVLQKTSNGP